MKKKKPLRASFKTVFTLDDLKKILFTKDDALETEQRINGEFSSLKSQLTHLEGKVESLEQTKTDKSDLLHLEKKLDQFIEQVSHVTFTEHSSMLEDHDKRLTTLEEKVSVS